MDREYLEDYEQREQTKYDGFLKRIDKGKFSFEKDRYPPDERFVKLQEPVTLPSLAAPRAIDLWPQVPFCGSLIISVPPITQSKFEEFFFEVSEISKVIDFIKETGKVQIALGEKARAYKELDYLDPFFIELKPPTYATVPLNILGTAEEHRKAIDAFHTYGKVFKEEMAIAFDSHFFTAAFNFAFGSYIALKLGRYAVVEDIENLMVDDPPRAYQLLHLCDSFIVGPIVDLRSNIRNFSLDWIKASRTLPAVYQPKELNFPCEIGKFLMKKLTYAPQGFRACCDIIDHYDSYNLQKVQRSLNEGIVNNHPDIVNKKTEEFSEILDNVWSDKTISRKVKGLQIGIPLLMAAIGSVAAGPIGAAGGFLAGLGYSVADKFIDLETEGLSERLAKLKTKSYQANVYDFKKKYKHRIVQE